MSIARFISQAKFTLYYVVIILNGIFVFETPSAQQRKIMHTCALMHMHIYLKVQSNIFMKISITIYAFHNAENIIFMWY